MLPERPSQTLLRSAIRRAAHQLFDEPLILQSETAAGERATLERPAAILRTQPDQSLLDGSVEFYIPKDLPGVDKELNCLPAPAGKFIVMLRMYSPNESNPSIIDGTWTIRRYRR